MFEFKQAKRLNKNVVSLVIEKNHMIWSNSNLKELCQFGSKINIDMSEISSYDWNSEEENTNGERNERNERNEEVISNLKMAIIPLIQFLNNVGCKTRNHKIALI